MTRASACGPIMATGQFTWIDHTVSLSLALRMGEVPLCNFRNQSGQNDCSLFNDCRSVHTLYGGSLVTRQQY